ncbi:MAG: hypothetical protein CL912_32340 [Deltaproteobacteria bacterium]|nr:hypothetical protein [Deltaproteobacteria bacterium]
MSKALTSREISRKQSGEQSTKNVTSFKLRISNTRFISPGHVSPSRGFRELGGTLSMEMSALAETLQMVFQLHLNCILADSPEDNVLPRPGILVIKVKGSDGRWSDYTAESDITGYSSSTLINHDATAQVKETIPAPNPNNGAFVGSDSEVLRQPYGPAATRTPIIQDMEMFQDSSMINYQSPGSGYPWEPVYSSHLMPVYNMLSGFGYSDESGLGYPELFGPSLNNEGQMAGAFPPMDWEQRSPLSQLQAAFSATPSGISQSLFHSLQYIPVGSRQETNLAIISTLSPEIHIRSLLRHAGKVLSENARDEEVDGLPSSEDVSDRLLSLLPGSATEHNFDNAGRIVRRDAIFDSPFHNALLYSIANGFAGIRDIPPGAVLRMLKEQPGMTNRIIECLESCPLAIAKSIADNLFRAAIEACDEEAVNFILRATRKSPYNIDLNVIVCKLHGNARLFTPIELAAKFRHLGIVQALITAGVDINHTKETNSNRECGPLELAIRKGGKYEPVDMVLVQSLLSAGAEVRLGLIKAIVPWGQDKILRNLIELLPRTEHKELFQGGVLTDIARFLERGSAAEIIQRVVMYCISSGCNRCWDENPKVMQTTLSWAARRGNRELVGTLLPYTAVRKGALAAAIRSRDEDLIERFLEEDPSMGKPPCYLFDNPQRLRSFGPDYTLPCTPLAEAIRSQNLELIERLESREALSFVKQEGRFEAAIFAAAEVGNCVYMEKLMQLVPDKRGVHLTPALNIAIRKNENKAALLLL